MTVTLIAPTLDIDDDRREAHDRRRRVSSSSSRPGTEAPSEMNFYFPRPPCAVHGGECHAHTAQPADPARRRRPRSARAGRATSPRRSTASAVTLDVVFASHHWPTWGRERVNRVPPHPARSLRLPPRSDAADAQPGLHRLRDRRAHPAAAGARGAWQHARLLRLGEPQREGDLPALPGLVRRQSCAPLAAPAGRGRPSATSAAIGGAGPRRARSRTRPSTRGDLRWVGDSARSRRVRGSRQRMPRHAARRPGDSSPSVPRTAPGGPPSSQAPTQLRQGYFGTPTATESPDLFAALTPEQLFDAIAIRVDGP